MQSFWISYIKILDGDALIHDEIINEHPFYWRNRNNKRNELGYETFHLIGWKELTPEEIKLYESTRSV